MKMIAFRYQAESIRICSKTLVRRGRPLMQQACIWRVGDPATEVPADGTTVCRMFFLMHRPGSLGAPKSAKKVLIGTKPHNRLLIFFHFARKYNDLETRARRKKFARIRNLRCIASFINYHINKNC